MELIITNGALSYGSNSHEIKIFDNLNLRFKQGQITGLLGPNGSGKSSLLKSIVGTIQLDNGQILFDGHDFKKASCSYIPQDFQPSFFTWASLMTNIKMVLPDFVKNWKKYTHFINLLKKDFEIDFELNKKPRNCSGGMLQQAAILRAFVTNPQILVADEPFSALDVEVSNRMRTAFRKKIVDNGIVGILISHNLEELLSMCDRVFFIPNKPYSSTEISGYFQVKELTNKHIDDHHRIDEITSLEKIALTIFDDEKSF